MTQPQYLDTLGLWDAALAFPDALHHAVEATLAARPEVPVPGGVQRCVFIGTGASYTVASAAAAYGHAHGHVVMERTTGPAAPGAAGPGTLVVAISPSGESEEVVEAAAAARERGATVVALTGGGALAGLAGSWAAPRVDVPAQTDRHAMAASLGSVFALLSSLELVDDAVPALLEACAHLRRRRDAWSPAGSPAEEMARRIGRTMPLVYGAQGLGAVAAGHWKRQFNENVKTPAFCGQVPDVAFGEVAGWGQHGDVTRQVLTLVTLRHHGEDALVARRFGHVVAAMDEVMADVLEVWAEGGDDLGRFLDLVLLGDFVTLHLAGREQIDPGPLAAQP